MRTWTACVALLLIACATPLCAQEGLRGIYKGRFAVVEAPGNDPRALDATLEIATAENGALAGTFAIRAGWFYVCRGNYSVQGSYDGNRLAMRTSAGSIRGCGMELLALTVQGNRLIGTLGAVEIEFVQIGARPEPLSR